jgi:hypothetical protein
MIWPFNIISNLRKEVQEFTIKEGSLQNQLAQQTALVYNAWKSIHELNHGRDHLIRLCKQRKQQLRDANIRPVEAYDFKEQEPSPHYPQTMIAIAIFLPNGTITKLCTPEKIELAFSSSLPSSPKGFADMMTSLTDMTNWKGQSPALWEYVFTPDGSKEEIPLVALRVDPPGYEI